MTKDPKDDSSKDAVVIDFGDFGSARVEEITNLVNVEAGVFDSKNLS